MGVIATGELKEIFKGDIVIVPGMIIFISLLFCLYTNRRVKLKRERFKKN